MGRSAQPFGGRRPLGASVSRRLGFVAGALVILLGLVTFAAPGPAFGDALTAHKSFTCTIRSLAANRNVTLATAPTGSLHDVLVATLTTAGAKASFQCIAIAGPQWALYSPQSSRYVTAEFGYAGKFAGALHAQATSPGVSGQFSFVHESACGCYAIRVRSKFVATETGYSGSTHNLLRARAATFAAAEKFSIVAAPTVGTTTTTKPATTTSTSTTTTTAPPPPPGVATAVAAGSTHTCAVTNAGAATCWGDNTFGQLGDGQTTGPETCMAGATFTPCSTTPIGVTALGSGVTAIATGDYHSCALTGAGAVLCWGRNDLGQLGNGTTASSATAVSVVGLTSGVIAISAGGDDTCALTAAAVKCWGTNAFGELADGTSTGPQACAPGTPRAAACSDTPETVTGLGPNARAVAVGQSSPQTGQHVCALSAAHTVSCWGNLREGQLADGTTTAPQTCAMGTPQQSPCATVATAVSGLPGDVSAIGVGIDDTCALSPGTGVLCWGDNATGELGIGNASGPSTCSVTGSMRACSTTPLLVPGIGAAASSLSVGAGLACAVTAGGVAKCWGTNALGQIGMGINTGPSQCVAGACAISPTAVLTHGALMTTVAATNSFACALTAAGGIECWGSNFAGQLGDGGVYVAGHTLSCPALGEPCEPDGSEVIGF